MKRYIITTTTPLLSEPRRDAPILRRLDAGSVVIPVPLSVDRQEEVRADGYLSVYIDDTGGYVRDDDIIEARNAK